MSNEKVKELNTVYQKLMFVYLYEHNGGEFDAEYMHRLLGLSISGVYSTLRCLKDRLLVSPHFGCRVHGESDTIAILDWEYLRLSKQFNLEIFERYLDFSDLEALGKSGLPLIARLILFVACVCGCRKYQRFPSERIAKIIGVERHIVSYWLKILDARGFLSVKRRYEVGPPLSPHSARKYHYPDTCTFFIKHLSIPTFFQYLHLSPGNFLIKYFSFREILYLAKEWHFCAKVARKNLKIKKKIPTKKSKKPVKPHPNSVIFGKMIQTWNKYNPSYFIHDLDRHLCQLLISFCKTKGIDAWDVVCKHGRDYLSGNYSYFSQNSSEYLNQKHWKSKGSLPPSMRLLVQDVTSKLIEKSPQKHCKSNENQTDDNRIKPARTRIENIRCLILYVLKFNVADKILRVFGFNQMKYSKSPRPPTEEEIKAREEIISEINATTEKDEIKCLRSVILKNLGAERYKYLGISDTIFTIGLRQNEIYVEAESVFRADYVIKKLNETSSSILSSYKFYVDQEWRKHKIMEGLCCG
jgi:hypothetical protein